MSILDPTPLLLVATIKVTVKKIVDFTVKNNVPMSDLVEYIPTVADTLQKLEHLLRFLMWYIITPKFLGNAYKSLMVEYFYHA